MLIINYILDQVKKSGFTQAGFAEAVGLTRFGLVNGLKKETIKLKDLKKIAEVLNVSIENLFQSIHSDETYLNESGTQLFREGDEGFNKINADNNSDSKLKTEIKFLKDKVKSMELIIESKNSTIEDKNEIINLLKGK